MVFISKHLQQTNRKYFMEAILASRNYIDVEPRYEWVRSDEYDTLLVDVSGMISLTN